MENLAWNSDMIMPMDKRLLQNLKNTWKNCNNASSGFLTNVPVSQLVTKPFEPRFTSFAYEFACLAHTRLCYIEALKTGVANFSDQRGIPSKASLQAASKSQLISLLSQASNEILAEIDALKSPAGLNFIEWLLQHERLHQGKLIVYVSQAGYRLPESLVKTWGESNFE